MLLEQRLRAQWERLRGLLGKRPKARALLEASTESEWMARSLEDLGHEVVVSTRADHAHNPLGLSESAARGG
ncbi:hypothetical protein [Myxococcus sp. Y35]|uniref:hypothetical protein n=1 Tax=Pseudomyxococcus flavus TaxID=3115648 RepID=UPI003CF9C355